MIISDRQIYLGYDIGEEFSQVCYYTMGMKGPSSISTVVGEDRFLIPTLLYHKNNGTWLYGDEALKCADSGEGILIKDLLSHSISDEYISIDGENVSYFSCLVMFLKKTINLVNIACGKPDEKRKIVFTTRELSPEIINLLERLCQEVFNEKDTIIFHSHKDSLFNYMLFQKKDLWINDVLLFDYGQNNFNMYRLRTNRNVSPSIVYIEETIKEHMIGLSPELRDQAFLSIINDNTMGLTPISSVYLTGTSFNDKWLDKSLKVVCRNRRAFIGQNLFAEGACYKAISSHEERADYLYLGEARLKVNIGIVASNRNEEQNIPILSAGGNWYDSQGQADIILDDSNIIELQVESLSGDIKTIKKYELLGLPNRPPRTTRIRIILKPVAVDRIKITFEDLGFGEIFRRSGKMWDFILEY